MVSKEDREAKARLCGRRDCGRQRRLSSPTQRAVCASGALVLVREVGHVRSTATPRQVAIRCRQKIHGESQKTVPEEGAIA